MNPHQLCFLSTIGLIGLALSGCDLGRGEPSSGPQVDKQGLNDFSNQLYNTDVTLDSLLVIMETVGPDSTAHYDAALASVVTQSNVIESLRRRYLTAGSTDFRRRISFIASQVRTPAAVEFLRELAYREPVIRASDDGDTKDQSYAVRTQAALGLAQSYIDGVANAADAIDDVLGHADVETCLLLALELYSSDALSKKWRETLIFRGIPSSFRRLEQKEYEELFKLQPEQERHLGSDTRTRPRSVSVPSEEE